MYVRIYCTVHILSARAGSSPLSGSSSPQPLPSLPRLPAPRKPNTSEAIELGPSSLPSPFQHPKSNPSHGANMPPSSPCSMPPPPVSSSSGRIYTAVAFGYSPYATGNFIALGGLTTLPFLASVRYARRSQDRIFHATGAHWDLTGLLVLLAVLAADRVVFGSLYVCWVLVALGFNRVLSKQLPDVCNRRSSMARSLASQVFVDPITAVQIGMHSYVGMLAAVVGLMGAMQIVLWRNLKAKKG
ncbi:hypothetical protein C8F04DRAFT_1101884 [Mycena alexandri]|uniref:Uncharacterized protein n=1 Tax=Mycena alexandri TaxID=1745969 RepID=A0AAD6SX89_9AGAR|nr:hypothetical protein C8F04DRAFT_1101884 [Mycena alexandri]